MQDNKKDKTLPFEVDDSLIKTCPLNLPDDIAELIKQGLSLEELIIVSRISKTSYLYFKPFLSTLVSFAADLFDWAKSLKPEDFSKYVVDIIDKHYVLASPNFKEKPIKGYLNASLKDSSDTRLAYILSSSVVATGTLNNLLILNLYPLMLQTQNFKITQIAMTEYSLNTNIALFTESAVKYAISNPNIIHLYSDKGTQLIFETLFDWVESLNPSEFKGLIHSSLAEYKKMLWTDGRIKEVQNYCQVNNGQQAKIIALIFQSNTDESIFNSILFCKLIAAIQKQIVEDFKKYSTASAKEKIKYEKYRKPGYKLIKEFDEKEHKEFYLKALKTNSEVLNRAQYQQDYRTVICSYLCNGKVREGEQTIYSKHIISNFICEFESSDKGISLTISDEDEKQTLFVSDEQKEALFACKSVSDINKIATTLNIRQSMLDTIKQYAESKQYKGCEELDQCYDGAEEDEAYSIKRF